jgi:hypothetical protein
VIGRDQPLLPLDHPLHVQNHAIQRRGDYEGPELIADEHPVAENLNAFHVEIGAREVARLRRLVDDPERDVVVGIAEPDALLHPDRSGFEIRRQPREAKQSVGGVGLGPEAVVNQRIDRAIGIAGMGISGKPLQGLTEEGAHQPVLLQ